LGKHRKLKISEAEIVDAYKSLGEVSHIFSFCDVDIFNDIQKRGGGGLIPRVVILDVRPTMQVKFFYLASKVLNVPPPTYLLWSNTVDKEDVERSTSGISRPREWESSI
jgi:hypothetical protein